MTGYCVSGDHGGCPDTHNDTYVCSCTCHLNLTNEEQALMCVPDTIGGIPTKPLVDMGANFDA